MKLQITAVCLSVLGIFASSGAAQDWSSWITSNNHDVQYRWLGRNQNENATCQLQLRDLKWSADTVVGVRIEYKYGDSDESTRDVVNIMNFNGEGLGERSVYRCVSVTNLHVTGIVRR